MERLRQYMLCIIGAAMLCSIAKTIVSTTKYGELIQLLCSLFLLFCLISPLHQMDFSFFAVDAASYSEAARSAVEEGKNIASEMTLRRIAQELETYILSKAEGMDLAISVDIAIGKDGIPEEILIQGTADPYQRETITQILEKDLGIPKENQTWTG